MHGSIWLFIGLDYSAWPLTVAAVAVPMALAPDRPLWSRPAPSVRLVRPGDDLEGAASTPPRRTRPPSRRGPRPTTSRRRRPGTRPGRPRGWVRTSSGAPSLRAEPHRSPGRAARRGHRARRRTRAPATPGRCGRARRTAARSPGRGRRGRRGVCVSTVPAHRPEMISRCCAAHTCSAAFSGSTWTERLSSAGVCGCGTTCPSDGLAARLNNPMPLLSTPTARRLNLRSVGSPGRRSWSPRATDAGGERRGPRRPGGRRGPRHRSRRLSAARSACARRPSAGSRRSRCSTRSRRPTAAPPAGSPWRCRWRAARWPPAADPP